MSRYRRYFRKKKKEEGKRGEETKRKKVTETRHLIRRERTFIARTFNADSTRTDVALHVYTVMKLPSYGAAQRARAYAFFQAERRLRPFHYLSRQVARIFFFLCLPLDRNLTKWALSVVKIVLFLLRR